MGENLTLVQAHKKYELDGMTHLQQMHQEDQLTQYVSTPNQVQKLWLEWT